MLDGFVGKQGQDCHGYWRHAAGGGGVFRAARPILHPVENIKQTHDNLLRYLVPFRIGATKTPDKGMAGYNLHNAATTV
ncbi:hypothetical protein BN961_03836 [Afipia felis]|uniref:Uncharacterized protein n=1 Tax=Afipia felis TaxID=1035 RepID=A0A090MVA2_AFIFE|nr:hypothetical protein BN961_03836 [Afipia felis]